MPPFVSFPVIPAPLLLAPEEERRLWDLAVRSVREHVLGRAERGAVPPPSPAGAAAATGGLAARSGVFVTLRRDGDLRGCIGTAEGTEPLLEAVERLARAAASMDRRFAPIRPEELADIDIEITVLGSLVRLPEDPGVLLDGIEPEKHGLRVRVGEQGGLLLPQVAQRFGWSTAELLAQVSLKAGLPRDAWRDPRAELFGFLASTIESRGAAGRG